MRGGGRIAHANPGDVICSYGIGGVSLSSPALGDDGTLYSRGSDGALYAINPNCTLKWKFQSASTSMSYFSSPVIADDGTIYFLTTDSLYAVTPGSSGATLKWQRAGIEDSSNSFWAATPAIGSEGTVYIGNKQGVLYAINPTDGSVKWQYQTGGDLSYVSPVIGSDGTLYIGSSDKGLFAVNSDGTLKWQFSQFPVIANAAAIGNDGTVYASYLVGGTSPGFCAITPSGVLKWKYDTSGLSGYFAISLGSDGTVYGSDGSGIYALTPDNGTLKWTYTASMMQTLSPPLPPSTLAVGADGTIYALRFAGFFYAINPDGTKKWVKPTVSSYFSSPVIASDGNIYSVSSYDPPATRKITVIQGDAPWTYTDYQNSMKGYANSPWPRFKQNNFNTGHRPQPLLSLPDIKVCAGTSTVSIPITLNNIAKSDIEGIEIKITYDTAILSNPNATLSGGILASSGYTLQQSSTGNEIHLSISTLSTLLNGSGIIAYLNFNIAGSGATDLKFTMSELNAKSVLAKSGSFSTDGYTVSGRIGYYSDIALKPVRDTHLKLTGPATFESNPNSGNDGNYTISKVCPAGTYNLNASKTTDLLNGLSATDASDISRHVVGLVTFNCHQKIAADVDQDGRITPVDATRVARYGLGKISCMNGSNPCVNWVFIPNPITSCSNWPLITYPKDRSVTLPPDATGQDFVAIRLGDVTGNWTPNATARSARDRIKIRENPTYTLTTNPGFMCKVPIVLNQSSEIRGIDISVGFDKAAVSASDAVLIGGILDGKEYSVLSDTSVAGKVTVWISAQNALSTGSGVVAYISFTPVAATQSSTTLTLTKFDVNETAVSGAFGTVSCDIPLPCDVDGDKKNSLPEAVYGLQCIAGLRQDCTCDVNLGKVIQTLKVLTGL
jgi:outer membrane protein assembly factor BamB